VTLPNYDCSDCAIRLYRQGAEYSSTYGFWSCADVSVVQCSKIATDSEATSVVKALRSTWINALSQRINPANGGKDDSVHQNLLKYMKNNNIPLLSKPQQSRVCEPNKPGCFDGYCLNGGTCNNANGQCNCQRLFTGTRCQYKGKKL